MPSRKPKPLSGRAKPGRAANPAPAAMLGLEEGLSLQRAGEFAAATAVYRAVLARSPADGRARTLLGLALCQAGRDAEGLPLLRQAAARGDDAFASYSLGLALAELHQWEGAAAALQQSAVLAPGAAPTHAALGHAHGQLGQAEQAAVAYGAALRLDPQAKLHQPWGEMLRRLGRHEEAARVYCEGLARDPGAAPLWCGLTHALLAAGRAEDALTAAERAFATDPELPGAAFCLGSALRQRGALDEAAAALRKAVARQPIYPEAYCNLSGVLYDLQDYHNAAISARTALAQQADHADALTSLGNALQALSQFTAAEAAYQRVLRLRPDAAAYSNLSVVLTAVGRLKEALAAQRQALALAPNFVDGRYNHAITLLKAGDYAAGWPLYETRWQLAWSPPRGFVEPQWRGEALEGQTILLHAEQGLGDTLQMVRYAPLVAARGGRVVLEVQAPLARLLRGMPGVDQVVTPDEACPAFEWHCPLFSLPLAFETVLTTVPGSPYLVADPALAAAWAAKMGAPGPLRVGLVWAGAGRIGTLVNRERSVAPSQLAALGDVPGVCFYSLQKHEGGRVRPADMPPLPMKDWTDGLADFADTAALVAQLDLVISVDTSTAHLAAAMGKPVWLLSRFNGCWRWLAEGAESPWYPTMRVFRQREFGDWKPVLAEVKQALTDLAIG